MRTVISDSVLSNIDALVEAEKTHPCITTDAVHVCVVIEPTAGFDESLSESLLAGLPSDATVDQLVATRVAGAVQANS